MAARKEIREYDLLEFSRCLLRQPHLIPYSKPLEIQAAEMTVRTVLWEMFEKKDVPGAMAVRDVRWPPGGKCAKMRVARGLWPPSLTGFGS